MHPAQLILLPIGKLWLLAAQLSFGASDRHPLAGTHPDQVRLKLREGGENVEEQLAHRVRRVIDAWAELKLHAAFGKAVATRASIRDRAR